MKKKTNAKDRRNKDLEKRRIDYSAKAEANKEKKLQEKVEANAAEEAKKFSELVNRIEAKDESLRKVKKSSAKAAGLKSTFVLDKDNLLMTSFGRGNDAVKDKYINNASVTDAGNDAKLSVAVNDKKFNVSSRVIKNATADNPEYSSKVAGEDMIHCKSQLEEMFFGRTFEDNIHIQLIYNILDIEKVLTVQVNNIVYELDNVLRIEQEEHDDFIGYLSLDKTYENFSNPSRDKDKHLLNTFKNMLEQPQLGYFGNTLLPGKKLSDREKEEYFKSCYHLFAVLGMLRQATAHGDEKTRAKIYTLGAEHDAKHSNKGCRVEARKELDRLYNKRIAQLNKEFLKTSNKDIFIILNAMGAVNDDEIKKLIRDYYGFVMLKSFKNMGFSIKRLRESIIETKAQYIGSDQYSTFRKKLYRAVDFAIYEYYIEPTNAEKAELLVERLRASVKDSEKEAIYRQEIETLWPTIKGIADKALVWMDESKIKEIGEPKYDKSIIEDITFKECADPFCEMIYFLTIFLDGKEINDMITQLINRFDNIRSFIDILESEGMCTEFSENYTLFNKSAQIVEEIRVINSFARMTAEEPTAKKVMFKEAAQLLGYEADDLDEYINEILDKESEYYKKRGSNFRNFIINNVIESTRFKYLVRYGNPAKLKAVANNRKVIEFVLKDIPDEQICAYYNSCNGVKEKFNAEMRSDLADKITGLSFVDFENVVQSSENPEKERKKNIVRLYLTVLYLLQKNLIYVNSRYFLAFHCAERDAMTFDEEKYNEDKLRDDRAIFAKEFIEQYPPKKRVQNYLAQNFNNSDKWALRTFRNTVEHLNVIRNIDMYIGDVKHFDSYFELYHYLVQRTLIDQFDYDCTHESKKFPGETIMSADRAEGRLLEYFDIVKKYNSYCKDFVKALNVPFAYNLARYKNLSINELFDRNNYNPNKAERI